MTFPFMKMTCSCMEMTFMHERKSMQENVAHKMYKDESAQPNFP